MERHKVMLVFGTRPEAIKLAPVVLNLRTSPCLEPKVVVTAQHREMLEQVMNIFGIRPDYDLNVMQSNQHPLEVMERVLRQLHPILEQEKPLLVLVQGDTITTFAAALTAFHIKIPIAHIEAGLRTYDKFQPFPEEINRRLTTTLTDWHFAPTEWARQNLLREGVSGDRIFITGNTVIDSLFFVLKHSRPPLPDWVTNAETRGQRLLLVTAHRRENWGSPIRHICTAIQRIIKLCPDVVVAFSVHMNPNVHRVVFEQLQGQERLFLMEPVDYVTFIHLMARSYLILTDSGGIQEEAPSLGKPVLVLRNVTERPEGVETGVLKVVGTEVESIVEEAVKLLHDESYYQKMAHQNNPYGNGKAAERIVTILQNKLCGVTK